jgi:hypothetical protein
MAGRSKNIKCQNCAALSFDAMMEAHGPNGDACYSGHACNNRRSYYRNRPTRLAKKRIQNLKRTGVPLLGSKPNLVVGQLVYYRDRKDSPVHLVEYQVVDGGELVNTYYPTGKDGEPVHTKGIAQSRLRLWIKQVIELAKVQHGCNTTTEIMQPTALCPLCREANDPH